MKKLVMMFFMIAAILTSCDNNDAASNVQDTFFAGVNSVTEIPVDFNADAMFKLDFYVNNGCGQFASFDETVEGNTHIIKILTKYEGEICTMDIPLREIIYPFNVNVAGTYTLKFLKTDGTYFTETVVVE